MQTLQPLSFPPRIKEVFKQEMDYMDSLYDSEAGLLGRRWRGGAPHHDIRGSSRYAAGLLARVGQGDLERACRVINSVLDSQLLYPDEVYHGTFKSSPERPNPPVGNFPWRQFTNEGRYWFDVYWEKITNGFLAAIEDEGVSREEALKLESKLNQQLYKHFPEVWRTYDPNWREFVGCAFALILELFDQYLPEELVARIDNSMREAVVGSIGRRISDMYPMNTNVELMHIYIADFFGHRFGDAAFIGHAQRYAADFYRRYIEFHTVAEWNSLTYYAVDLGALAQWRMYGKSNIIKELGPILEAGLWEDAAKLYNPPLKNLCGPYSRNHDMDMANHSSFPVYFYINFESEHFGLPQLNDEHPQNILTALCPTEIPGRVKPAFLEFQGERSLTAQFRELIERGEPSNNDPLCTATSWISRDLMIGGLSGSLNVSGQIHPATAHWKAPDGSVSSMRLLRREAGLSFGKGNRSIIYNASVEKNIMDIRVDIDIERDVEIFFQFSGSGFSPNQITADKWLLPGLTIHVDIDAPEPSVAVTENGIEVVYPYDRKTRDYPVMRFRLRFEI